MNIELLQFLWPTVRHTDQWSILDCIKFCKDLLCLGQTQRKFFHKQMWKNFLFPKFYTEKVAMAYWCICLSLSSCCCLDWWVLKCFFCDLIMLKVILKTRLTFPQYRQLGIIKIKLRSRNLQFKFCCLISTSYTKQFKYLKLDLKLLLQ